MVSGRVGGGPAEQSPRGLRAVRSEVMGWRGPADGRPARRVPDNSLPYLHKRPQVRLLLLALLCLAASVVWGVFRNEDQ